MDCISCCAVPVFDIKGLFRDKVIHGKIVFKLDLVVFGCLREHTMCSGLIRAQRSEKVFGEKIVQV